MNTLNSDFNIENHDVNYFTSLPSGFSGEKKLPDTEFRTTPYATNIVIANGKIIINGIALSERVLEELREAGINALWCTPHQVKTIRECVENATNPKLIEESNVSATDFYDALDPEEPEQTAAQNPEENIVINTSTHLGKLLDERQKSQHHSAAADHPPYSTYS